jgi:hypothetical protein
MEPPPQAVLMGNGGNLTLMARRQGRQTLTRNRGSISIGGKISWRRKPGNRRADSLAPVKTARWDSPTGKKALNPMPDDEAEAISIVPGRGCGDCSLCCKLIRVDALAKPPGTWCMHCAPGNGGCTIYDSRPTECRSFYCAWMVSPSLGEGQNQKVWQIYLVALY